MAVYLCILGVGFCLGLRYRVSLLGLVSILIGVFGVAAGLASGVDVFTILKTTFLSAGCLQLGYVVAAITVEQTRPLIRYLTS